MDTFIEIMRRVRFLWALGWIAGTAAIAFASPAVLPWRIGAPTLAWLALYLQIPGPFRTALCWAGVMGTIAMFDRKAGMDWLIMGGIGTALILAVSFLLAPLFKRGA